MSNEQEGISRRTLLSGFGAATVMHLGTRRAAGDITAQAKDKPQSKPAGRRPRARDLGIPLDGTSGPWNTITDIKGVEVGHTTLISGDGKLVVGKGPVRTGVTAIFAPGKKFDPVFAAFFAM